MEFSSYDDMKYALRKLDDTEFVGNYTGGRAYIRIREDRPGGGGGGDRDRRRCVLCRVCGLVEKGGGVAVCISHGLLGA